VNALLCIIGEKGKVDVDAIVAAVKGEVVQASQIGHKGQMGQSEETAATKPQPATSNQQPATSNKQPETTVAATSAENGRVKASPLAKKLQKKKVLT
jgi:pyruvate dehydrogenase E2 component (dihydrolipoamide acetyltransferase)